MGVYYYYKRVMVLVSKKDRMAIFRYLMQEGVLVVKKDNNLAAHPHVTQGASAEPIKNLHVMMLLKSLKSREYVDEIFSWQWSYYTLTDAGVKYIREQLGLPPSVIPPTHRKGKKLQDERRPPKKDVDTTPIGDASGATPAAAPAEEAGPTRAGMGRGSRFD